MIGRRIPSLLIALILIMAPASAATYQVNEGTYYQLYHDLPWLAAQGDRTDFDAAAGEINVQGSEDGLWEYYLGLNPDSDVTINFTTYGGLTGSAEITSTEIDMFSREFTITVDGISQSKVYTSYFGFLFSPIYFRMYPARNLSDEFDRGIIYALGSMAFYEEFPINSQPIQRINYASSDVIDGYAVTGDALATDGLLGYVTTREGMLGWFATFQDLLSWVTKFASATFPVIETLVFWFNLIFIQNIVITAVLYVLGTLALSVDRARGDPFKALANWWKYQMKLWDFIQRMVYFVLGLAEKVKNIFWPV
ncbi:MAG: hypothetical protein WC683_04815 [bacterium]